MQKKQRSKKRTRSPRLCKSSAPVNRFNSYSGRAFQYALDILSGKRIAGKKVKLACQRFLDDLDRVKGTWKWKYEPDRADVVCALIELFPHEKGELQGDPVRLGDWQCFIFCNLFGWINKETGFRRFREALILIPRGNGKSPMGAWVANYMAWFDGEKGAEVYCAATTEDQAFEVFRPAKAVVEMMGLDERLGIKVPKGEAGRIMYQPSTRSRLRVIIGKPKDGKAPHAVINDEYHQQPDDKLYDSLKRGMNKRKQSLMFNISTAGDTIEGPCYRMCEQVENVLARRYENDRLFGIIYDVDKDVDWTTEKANIMANPNYGISIDAESMADDQKEAVHNTAKQGPYRCKNQNHWSQAADGWMNMEYWDSCKVEIKEEEFLERACYHGSDLASTLDIAGTVKLFQWVGDDGKSRYAVFPRAYLPETQAKSPGRPHLQAWEKQRLITATPGASIDYQMIEDDTVADVERYKISELAFDPRYAGQYAQRIKARTGIEIVEIRPTPDEFSPAMKELEAAVADKRLQHDGNPVLRWCMANILAIANQATGNYRMPGKDRPEKKIDLGVALLIAMCRARLAAPKGSVYDTEGITWF